MFPNPKMNSIMIRLTNLLVVAIVLNLSAARANDAEAELAAIKLKLGINLELLSEPIKKIEEQYLKGLD